MCNESPDRWRVRQRGRQESSAPDFREETARSVPDSFSRQFVPGDEEEVPRRWAGGGGVFVPTPFAQRREARHSQNRLRSDPSSIDSQLPRRPRWSDITLHFHPIHHQRGIWIFLKLPTFVAGIIREENKAALVKILE